MFKEEEIGQETKRQVLRDAIQKGLDSGEATPLDMAEIIAEAKARYTKK